MSVDLSMATFNEMAEYLMKQVNRAVRMGVTDSVILRESIVEVIEEAARRGEQAERRSPARVV
jgi:hypothetical protein